jgi:hypothetical protein
MVPELACRQHIVIELALARGFFEQSDILSSDTMIGQERSKVAGTKSVMSHNALCTQELLTEPCR